ncbi:Neutral/alkaline non-lysosomal ceramidase [Thalassoglobus neptunius]|uniref:Neutral/alkaline non-lysosomal ceramidase n=2 Tax=Thalassoglobus neptunius TaxID=1938619 RepID=A0A5C5X5Y7_9PLAN|nr:Neutral/alkaline non-lysosomal ceramidase [Thalassoglobus neptunius]
MLCGLLTMLTLSLFAQAANAALRVGAVATEITPVELPVLVNGSMVSRTVSEVTSKLHARTVVVDDGEERLAICVVDSCMLPKSLIDDVKALAATKTKLKPDHILISATHTHSAPSSMGALGTSPDEQYVAYLRDRLVNSLVNAEKQLEPAVVGWGQEYAEEYTALRRWIYRTDKPQLDPFGNPTVKANMHAARSPDDVTGESGPEDPVLSLLSFQSPDGRPIALIANFSMHYFGDKGLSSDYFGLFSNGLQEQLSQQGEDSPPFVAMMSHGCSGDIWRRDYRQIIETGESSEHQSISEFADGLIAVAKTAYDEIEYQPAATIDMAEARFTLDYRTPDQQRLKWAEKIVQEMDGRLPKTRPEIYAREQVLLDEMQSTEVVVQALRIGDFAIATTPNETYALSGLKIKRSSPFEKTMVIELANGGDGYIPPPEQHYLGGYNTWAARSAGLEVQAEPKIVAAAKSLLETVAGRPGRSPELAVTDSAQSMLERQPAAYYRLSEMSGPIAMDATSHGHHGFYEPGIAYFLEGPTIDETTWEETNRCSHFAGGRLATVLKDIGDEYTISLWVWNGLPDQARDPAPCFFSRAENDTPPDRGTHLGLKGNGVLCVSAEGNTAEGVNAVSRWKWAHVVFVVKDKTLTAYLDQKTEPEFQLKLESAPRASASLFFGGRADGEFPWQGRLDEIVVFDRALSRQEIRSIQEENSFFDSSRSVSLRKEAD